jgi:hypothetical protein
LIDAKRNRWVHLKDGSPLRLQHIDLATNDGVNRDLTGALTTMGGGYYQMVHDTDNDRYLVLGGGVLYSIDPETASSTLVTVVPMERNGVNGRFAYFPALGGAAYLPRYSSDVLFMPTR